MAMTLLFSDALLPRRHLGWKVRAADTARQWAVRVSGNRLAHVALLVQGRVLWPSAEGDRIVPFERYAMVRPVRWCVEVPGAEVDLLKLLDPRPIRARWIVHQWWTHEPYSTCVTRAVRCLRAAGVAVAPDLITPDQLFRELTERGYPFVRGDLHVRTQEPERL